MNLSSIMPARIGALAVSLLLMSAAAADGADNLGRVYDYYITGGDVWRQDNTNHTSGDDSPVAYIKKYQWGPGKAIVVDDTYALMADGSCVHWTHNIFHWDLESSTLTGQIFHLAGFKFYGEVVSKAEYVVESEMRAVMPDGTEFRMRDVTDTTDPDTAVVTASIWNGESWDQNAPIYWQRETGETRPCGL